MRRVLLIATGGTIASLPEENGLAPAMTGEELAARVPQLAEVCDFDVVQPMNIDSTNMIYKAICLTFPHSRYLRIGIRA